MSKYLYLLLSVAWATSLSGQHIHHKKWDRIFGGIGFEKPIHILSTEDNANLILGYTTSGSGYDITEMSRGSADVWLLKIDSTGRRLWDRRYGGFSEETPRNICAVKSGGYIIACTTFSGVGGDKSQPSWGNTDFWLIRIDERGNKLWDRRFGGSGYDDVWQVITTSDGGFLVGGDSGSGISGDKSQNNRGSGLSSDAWIVKVDSAGNKQWDRRYGTSGDEGCRAVYQTLDGGYLLAAVSNGDSTDDLTQHSVAGGFNTWLIKTDSLGNMKWDKIYGGQYGEVCASVFSDFHGGYVLSGYAPDTVSGNKTSQKCGYWMIRIDSAGNKTGDWTYGSGLNCGTGFTFDLWESTTQTKDHGYLLSGESKSTPAGDKSEANLGLLQGWIVKLDSQMLKQWDKTVLSYGENDAATCSMEMGSGCFMVALTSNSIVGGDKSFAPYDSSFDYWIVVYCDTLITAIPEVMGNLCYSIYPNPTVDEVSIHFESTAMHEATFTLFDPLGYVVYQSDETNMSASYTKSLDLSKMPSGTYILDIVCRGQRITKKIIKY